MDINRSYLIISFLFFVLPLIIMDILGREKSIALEYLCLNSRPWYEKKKLIFWDMNSLKGHVPASVVIAALVIAILVLKIDYYFAYSCQSKYARPGLPSPSQLIAADRDVTKVGGNSSRILEPNCDWYYFGTCMRYLALCGHSEHAICVRALFC